MIQYVINDYDATTTTQSVKPDVKLLSESDMTQMVTNMTQDEKVKSQRTKSERIQDAQRRMARRVKEDNDKVQRMVSSQSYRNVAKRLRMTSKFSIMAQSVKVGV